MKLMEYTRIGAIGLCGLAILLGGPTKQVKAAEATKPKGARLLENKEFDDSKEARKRILKLYKGLRVTDVSDGLDLIGLQDVGIMDREIRPLWRDTEDFSHRFVGFALTVRHVPTDVRVGQGSFDSIKEAKEWKGEQYGRAPDAWMDVARPNDVAVIDANGVEECGYIGSNNSLGWAREGIAGVVTNGGARDTDEIIKTGVMPVYCPDGYSTRGIRPGRLIAESYNFPINCGGVLVYPGDVIVGDGDGVIVVPREHAIKVGKLARQVHSGDQSSRAEKFEDLGIPLDETVKEYD